MTISRNSIRVQFTLNTTKEKEKQILEFLDECINPNNSIKEIIYNYIVSNGNTKLPQVTQTQDTQSNAKSLKVSKNELLDNNVVSDSEEKLPKVSNEIELNEMEELKKFM